MGTIVQLNLAGRRERPAGKRSGHAQCEVVIFPGVRIERHGIDLSRRIRPTTGHNDFDGVGGGRRPRKTS